MVHISQIVYLLKFYPMMCKKAKITELEAQVCLVTTTTRPQKHNHAQTETKMQKMLNKLTPIISEYDTIVAKQKELHSHASYVQKSSASISGYLAVKITKLSKVAPILSKYFRLKLVILHLH